MAALKRRRISFPLSDGDEDYPSSSKLAFVAEKGHFVVYSADRKRFKFLIKYLNNCIIQELFWLAEEEFGLPADGPITLPYDASFLQHIISLFRGKKSRDCREPELLIAASRCSFSYSHQH